ncbi:hypothetical protein N474_15760 [Pseudoalteromonas luteoviolacea CPMOR-2]|uniref:Uncharacterized protein n=1 Tax=Pseudoalteromonas luteoviolacea DSM 6061 TaxID=1365250 RepID=A0A166XS00_9GAMM|nr:carotenoid oxygenase family protein [Pseudoalteromonas luteoviolacea]KZN40727.1 hypothetical protein N475_11405 [Pseudoalteromonas luteoviolacea DSM 6061]KZN55159.1 hypothetical protein N474_15760 [Pseudoalteromonas luteoviolacea CPMOR-2]MBE0387786.1 hypothetical protein [Pseudoalteromonas luteoviolacea DSM 6061]
MERRQFIKGMVAAPVVHAVSPNVVLAANSKTNESLILNLKRFNAALEQHPELIGFKGTETNLSPQELTIEGKLPTDLTGQFYRNGPGRHHRQKERYLHLFEGDGMVHRFSIGNHKVRHQAKFVRTDKFKQEEQAGKYLYSGPDSKLANSLPIPSPDSINTANTNVLPVNGELWALWEAGSATAIDSNTLNTKGLVNIGEDTPNEQSLKGLPFSAHPKIEADGTIWNFGYAQSGHVVLYQISRFGKLLNVGMINTGFKGGMLHDFLITERHLILLMPSLKRNRTIEGHFSSIQFNAQQAMEVFIIDKQSFNTVKRYELEPGFVFHFGNAWEDKQGNIHFDASLYPNGEVLQHMTKIMQGSDNVPLSPANTVLFTLYKNGKVRKRIVDGISEFPRIYSHLTGKQNNKLFTLSSVQSDVWSDSVRRIDLNSEKQDTYTYGKDFLVEEHVLVNQNNKESGGYLIGTALHIPSKRTCLNILRADDVSAGPICRAWLPHVIPLGFHGNFMPTVQAKGY